MYFARLVIALWLGFYAYWAISAIGVKKNVRKGPWWRGRSFRFLLLIFILLLFRLRNLGLLAHHRIPSSNPVIQTVGVALCVVGFAFAIWARMRLGRNWGEPMSLKEGHELVTTGPYRYVRHPIYTGILLAMLGSALVVSPVWLVAFLILGPYFIYSARTEERLMMQEFPHEYPGYMRRTKALIPFVW